MTSVYEVVRDRIISSLEAGTVPWRQTWQSLCPVNVATGKPYRGINCILLCGHAWWGTYYPIQKMGGHVRTGEEGEFPDLGVAVVEVVGHVGELEDLALPKERVVGAEDISLPHE
jgi:hypothetical protein